MNVTNGSAYHIFAKTPAAQDWALSARPAAAFQTPHPCTLALRRPLIRTGPCRGAQGPSTAPQKFSDVSSIGILHSQFSGELTFEESSSAAPQILGGNSETSAQ